MCCSCLDRFFNRAVLAVKSFTMPAGDLVPPSLTEQHFLLHALRSTAVRVDGRKFGQARPVRIEFSNRQGWCQVSLGHTV